jgi:hypothetical protein
LLLFGALFWFRGRFRFGRGCGFRFVFRSRFRRVGGSSRSIFRLRLGRGTGFLLRQLFGFKVFGRVFRLRQNFGNLLFDPVFGFLFRRQDKVQK